MLRKKIRIEIKRQQSITSFLWEQVLRRERVQVFQDLWTPYAKDEESRKSSERRYRGEKGWGEKGEKTGNCAHHQCVKIEEIGVNK